MGRSSNNPFSRVGHGISNAFRTVGNDISNIAHNPVKGVTRAFGNFAGHIIDPTGHLNSFATNTFGGGNPDDPNMASNLRSQIAREEWADYKQRFQPIENKLLGFANNSGQFMQDQAKQSLGAINDAYGRAPANINREYNLMGMQYTPEQQGEITRRLGTEQGLGQVQGLNLSNRLSQEQLLGIMGGGMFQGNKGLIGGMNQSQSVRG